MVESPAQPLVLLDVDPDLGDGIPPEDWSRARELARGERLDLHAGESRRLPLTTDKGPDNRFAALIVDGLLVRERVLRDTVSAEILGPGDILEQLPVTPGVLPTEVRIAASTHTTIVIFGSDFLNAMTHWPVLGVRLFERLSAQNSRLSLLTAIGALPRVETRVLAVLWHLAGLWGRVAPDGVLVPLRLTHEAIGHMCGAQRPTVSLAIRSLVDEGSVIRRPDGRYVVREGSQQALAPMVSWPTSNSFPIPDTAPGAEDDPAGADEESSSGATPLGADGSNRGHRRLQTELSTLAASEALFRAIFDQAPLGVAILDVPSGRIERANARLCRMLGHPLTGMQNVQVRELSLAKDPRKAMHLWETFLERGAPIRREAVVQHRSGGEVAVRVNVSALATDLDGHPTMAIAMIEDISALRDVERARVESERRLLAALAAFDLVPWEWDIARDEMRLLGGEHPDFPFDGLALDDALHHVHPDDREATGEAIRSTARGERPYLHRFRMNVPDGSVHHVASRAALERGPSGEPLRLLGAMRRETELADGAGAGPT